MKELVKLYGLLVKIGDSQGMETHETKRCSFDYVGKFQDAIELDNKIQQLQTATATAQAETEHWQARSESRGNNNKGEEIEYRYHRKYPGTWSERNVTCRNG